MARKIKLPLKYAVNTIDNNMAIKNYELISISLDRETYSQDEMASLIENSIDTIFLAKEDYYIPLSKEDIHYININECSLIIKVPVNFDIETQNYDNTISSDKNLNIPTNKVQKENLVSSAYDLRELFIDSDVSKNTSLNGSGFYYSSYGKTLLGYGLDLI